MSVAIGNAKWQDVSYRLPTLVGRDPNTNRPELASKPAEPERLLDQSILTVVPYDGDQLPCTLPLQIISQYVRRAVQRAFLDETEDGRWFAEIKVLPGVWAEGETPESALEELAEVAHQWILMKIADHDRDIPILNGVDLNRL